jgi:hypothetical protein
MSNLLFIYDGVNGGADALGMPRSTAWFILYITLAVLVGFVFYLKSRFNFMVALIALTAMLFLGWLIQLLPMWVPVVTLVLTVALGVTRREVST